jgi:hypothetical protein
LLAQAEEGEKEGLEEEEIEHQVGFCYHYIDICTGTVPTGTSTVYEIGLKLFNWFNLIGTD